MGHIYSVIALLFFVVFITAAVYFHYLYAVRHPLETEQAPDEISDGGLRFTPKTMVTIFYALMAIAIPSFFIIYLPTSDSLSKLFFWFLFDISFPTSFTVIIAAIKGFRSYLHIYPDGLKYRDTFCTKWYPKEEVEGVYQTSEFIFVKRKGRKIPLVIENLYTDRKTIFALLTGLVNHNKPPEDSKQTD